MDYKKLKQILSDGLDDVDSKLIDCIKKEAYTALQLAKVVDMSSTGVQKRLQKLEKKGKVVSVTIRARKYYCDPEQIKKKAEKNGAGRPKGSKNKKKKSTPYIQATRKGKRWTKAEDVELMKVLNAYKDRNRLPNGVTQDLARRLNRPLTAIWTRICSLRKTLPKKEEKMVTERDNTKVKGSFDYTKW